MWITHYYVLQLHGMILKKFVKPGVAYKTASVCIPPDFVASAHESYPDLNVCTVIGFPLGYETTEVKVAETKQALAEGGL